MSSVGHAGYAEYGTDIVCAAVSVLLINTVNALESLTEDDIRIEASEDGGNLSFWLDFPISEKAAVLMDALILGLKSIEHDYGKQYVKLLFKEV